MLWYLICAIIGFYVGWIVKAKLNKDKYGDINVEIALEFLKSKGYWVKLNVGPGKDGKEEGQIIPRV